jgi:hypothetical protein
LATGHSCRSQVERALGFAPQHPAQALLSVLAPRAGHARQDSPLP